MELIPIGRFIEYAGESEQAKYICEYAKYLECTKMYVEEKYTDKDYIKDFQMFYSRSFEQIPNTVKRVFFFKDELGPEDLIGRTKSDDEVNESCIGFVTIKPVLDQNGNPIVGRTVLENYGENEKRVFIESKQHAYIAGREMNFKALPFKSQDIAVGACASVALWIVTHGLRDFFDIPDMSLFEITEIANKYPTSEGRMFPSKGLSPVQMCSFLHEIGLEVELADMSDGGMSGEYFETIVKAFISANVPIVAGLTLIGNNREDHHAVVISGYQSKTDGHLSKIYVHDDQIGPYASVKSKDMFKTWEYKENDAWSRTYNSVRLDFVMVPLYHKIRLPFSIVLRVGDILSKKLEKQISIRLANSNRYKKELRVCSLSDLSDLERPMPKYIWIYSLEAQDKCADIIFDATSANIQKICEVYYQKRVVATLKPDNACFGEQT